MATIHQPSGGIWRPAVEDTIPLHTTYTTDEKARRFWRASFRCGRGYLSGPDAMGRPVLVEHEREEKQSYERRLRLTKPRNFVGPILRRYNDLVFRRPPVRPENAPPIYDTVVEDATGGGVPLNMFMRRALLRAQIDREAWLMLDVVGPDGDALTVAQVEESGARPILRRVSSSAVVNWREDYADDTTIVAEAWVVMRDADGVLVCRMFDDTRYQDAVLSPEGYDKGMMVVQEYHDPVVHGYDGVPLVRLQPSFDPLDDDAMDGSLGESQASPLAESQQAVLNLLSLAQEEIANVTFSQMIAFGVTDAQVGDAKVGNNRVLCVPNPAGSVSMIGADPAQADSIRQQILDEVGNLFRLAGVNQADASVAPASGIALAFRHNDLATIVSSLAQACEDAETAIWGLMGPAWGFEPPAPTVYQGKDADLPDFGVETASMATVVANAALPPLIRQKVAERYAVRNLSLSDEETETLRAQIEQAGALSRESAYPPGASRDRTTPTGRGLLDALETLHGGSD